MVRFTRSFRSVRSLVTMGAFFTALLASSEKLRDTIGAYFSSLPVANMLNKFSFPWPPSVDAVRKFSPHFFFTVFVPKFVFDVWSVSKKPAEDARQQKEETKRLEAALLKANCVLHGFRRCNLVVPPEFLELRDTLHRQLDVLFERFSIEPPSEEDAAATNMKFVEDVIPGLADGTLTFPGLVSKDADKKGGGADSPAGLGLGQLGDDDGGGGGDFPDAPFGAPFGPPGGGGPDEHDSTEEDLTTFHSNLNVAVNKITIPRNPSHALFEQAVETKSILSMVHNL